MFPFERQNKIIHLLDQNSKITVPELSRILMSRLVPSEMIYLH